MEKARQATGAANVVVVMSGNFVQRGEPAIVDKRTRVLMALSAGADVVLELPLSFSVASAAYFAGGAVRVLQAAGIVGAIAFGAEAGLARLQEAAALVREEPPHYRETLKTGLAMGLSYPRARALAAGSHAEILEQPNNILGIEYINALHVLGSSIKCVAIERTVAHDDGVGEGFASASVVRKQLLGGGGVPGQFLPHASSTLLNSYGTIHRLDNLSSLFHYRVRSLGLAGLAQMAEVGEGLEHRIMRCASRAHDISDIISYIKTKRYTQSKIRRMLLGILLGTERANFEKMQQLGPPYVRVLGFRRGAEQLLKNMSAATTLPVITSLKAARKLPAQARQCLAEEMAAADIYYLSADGTAKRLAGRAEEWRFPVVF